MPTIQKETAVLTLANNDNLWANSTYEFMRQNGVCSAGVVASATGAFLTITSGPDVVLEESPPMVLGTMPIVPDHFFYNWAAAMGDRLVARVRNPTVGTITFRSVLNIQYA